MYNTKPISQWVIKMYTILQLFVSLYDRSILFFSYISEHNPFIIDYSDKQEQITDGQHTEEEQVTQEQKPEILYEYKHLESFKKFPNDYQFTEQEVQEERDTFIKMKTENHLYIEQNKTKIQAHLGVIEGILKKTFEEDIDEQVKNKLVEYYQLDEEDPDEIAFDELYLELITEKVKYEEEIKKVENTLLNDEQIKEAAHQHIVKLKLDKLMNSYVLEHTPLGNIFMRYNNDKQSFEYFSNSTIPYRYLESVGQKYVMTYWCKPIFIDIEEELKKAEIKYEEELKKQEIKKQEIKNKDPKNLMAKMKSYNKDTMNMISGPGKNRNQNYVLPPQIQAQLPNVKTNSEKQLLKENANRYTWEGRMANFSPLKKIDKKIVNKKLEMSFADFKRIQNKK